MSVHISTTRNLLNWPQNTDLSDYQILNRVNAIATDDDGSDLTNAIKVDASNVNWHRLGSYTLYLYVDGKYGSDQKEISVDVIPSNNKNSHRTQKKKTKNSNQKRSKKWLIIGLIALILILLGFGLNSCQRDNDKNQEIQDSQSSKIAQNSSSIDSLNNKNKNLQEQINALKNADQSYQNDHNQTKLENTLDQIKAQNEKLKDQLNNRDYQNLTNATNQLANNPDSSSNQYLDALEHGNNNNNKVTQTFSWLHNQIENWINNPNK